MNFPKLNKKNQTQKYKKNAFNSLEKRLLAYSVAAGAAISGIESAEATIIYKNLGDIVVSGGTYSLEINDDGQIDFRVLHSSGIYSSYNVQFAGASNFAPVNNGFAGKGFVISKLDLGEVIDENYVDGFIKRGNFGSLYSSNGQQIPTGNFLGADKDYFAFRFSDKNNLVFNGWGRVSMPMDGSSITFHDVAYNDVAGASIMAGETEAGLGTAVPEPGTLGMLALGAAGVCAWRKRKDTKDCA